MANKKTVLHIEIPGIPPSLNDSHKVAVRNGRVWKYPHKSLKEWLDLVGFTLEPMKIVETEWYGAEYIFYFPIYCKNGNIRRKDVSNLIKYVEDPIMERVTTYEGKKIDDSRFLEVSAMKVDSPEDKTEINIYAMI